MTTPQEDGFLRLKIASKEKIARDIWSFELTDPQGAPLPPFEAGANLTVAVPNGSRRTY
ncbi:phthalate 4,5-dioxygenase, partial [Burkholderia multivorans]